MLIISSNDIRQLLILQTEHMYLIEFNRSWIWLIVVAELQSINQTILMIIKYMFV